MHVSSARCLFLVLSPPLAFPLPFLTVPLLTVPCFPDRVKWHPSFHVYNLNWKYTQAFVDGLSVLHDISFHLFLAIWIKPGCGIYVWIAGALGRAPVTLMTWKTTSKWNQKLNLVLCAPFQIDQIPTSLLCLLILVHTVLSTYCSSSLSWVFNCFLVTESPSGITHTESLQNLC